jgi:hypothetical protein
MIRAGRTALRSSALLVLIFTVGCGHMSWPWHRRSPAPPPEVHELTITAPDGSAAAFPQYWKRNTLVVDLQGASGTGSVVLKPRERTTWPVRLAFRVMPGQIGLLELRADQRMLLPITTQGTKPVDLEVVPGVYTPRTPQITVSWEPRSPTG